MTFSSIGGLFQPQEDIFNIPFFRGKLQKKASSAAISGKAAKGGYFE